MHRTFKTTLAIMSQTNPVLWPKFIDDAQYALNTMIHATTGAQPYFAFFSRYARRYIGIDLPTIEGEVRGEGMAEAHKII